MTFLLLLLSLLLLHTANSSVYTVIPDDHYYPNTTCHHCHNLQYYLLNATKYFTSNIQLLFLPGIHHLNTDLIIQNVHNISLIGINPNTVIHCNSSVGIVMANVVSVVVTNMIFSNCSCNSIEVMDITRTYKHVSVMVINCYYVLLQKVMILSHEKLSLLAVNVLGELTIDSLKSKKIQLVYNDLDTANEQVQLTYHVRIIRFDLLSKVESIKDLVSHYYILNDTRLFDLLVDSIFNSADGDDGIIVGLQQTSYNITILLINTNFSNLINYIVLSIYLTSSSTAVENLISIINCNFKNNNSGYQVKALVGIQIFAHYISSVSERNRIVFQNCSFVNNTYTAGSRIKVKDHRETLNIH